jgi:hypothetical protein
MDLDMLINNFIFEKTPLGNVIMFYNNKRTTFDYYSDNSIPYRYLETICRKYVTIFHCKNLYIDMNNELKNYENLLLEKERVKQKKEEEKEEREEKNISDKKNVFAKFKNYNKDINSGRINVGIPPKNSISNVKINNENENKILLKENSNKYSYQGKISNFSILKKIDKKIVDKKLNLKFSDFKNMNLY